MRSELGTKPHTLLLTTRSETILQQKEKKMLCRFISLQLGKRFLSLQSLTGHCLGYGQADSLDTWKGRDIKMVSKVLLEKSSPWLFSALMHSAETQAEVLRADWTCKSFGMVRALCMCRRHFIFIFNVDSNIKGPNFNLICKLHLNPTCETCCT